MGKTCALKVPRSHRILLLIIVILIIFTNVWSPDVFYSLNKQMTSSQIYNFSKKMPLESCKSLGTNFLHRKIHFRWKGNQKDFITIGSLLTRPNCVLCALVCQENEIYSGVRHQAGGGTENKIQQYTPWKHTILNKLANIVQKQIITLQTPQDCSTARKMVCRLYTTGNGLGHQLHHVTYCLLMAYVTNRTLILITNTMKNYGKNAWDEVFIPVSNCSLGDEKFENLKNKKTMQVILNSSDEIIRIPEINHWKQPAADSAFLFLAIPEDIAFLLTLLNDDPPAWWIGQFMKYVFRLRPNVESKLERELQSKFTGMVAGVHIRRGDKVGKEAEHHNIDEYMFHVTHFFESISTIKGVDSRRVYIATDDNSVFDELESRYSYFSFIYDRDLNAEAIKRRNGLFGIIRDIYLLSNSDFVVCTFTSNVCRVVYELLQARGVNTTHVLKSIDSIYHLNKYNNEVYVALKPFRSQSLKFLNMSVGDILERPFTWEKSNIYFGKNMNKNTAGYFPVKMVKRVWPLTQLPSFADIDY